MAKDTNLQVELIEELHQVVGEGVVVVDHHQTHDAPKIKKAAQMSLGGFRLNITLHLYKKESSGCQLFSGAGGGEIRPETVSQSIDNPYYVVSAATLPFILTFRFLALSFNYQDH
jgi:hypothetical protein